MKVDIFVEDKEGKTFIMQSPKSIRYQDLKKLISDNNISAMTYHHQIAFRGTMYGEESLNKVLNFEEGDKIKIYDNRVEEGATFHKNPHLNEGDMNTCPLTGNLRLFLLKYISQYINENFIQYPQVKNIIIELKQSIKMEQNPKKDIQTNLKEITDHNILTYNQYICSIVNDNVINYLLNLVPNPNVRNDIIKYWSILSKYETFNKLFEAELYKAIEESYFDYSLIGLSLYQQNNKNEYLAEMKKCPNRVIRYLFHGTQIEALSNIITEGFLYARRAFFGMGVYFSDMLDYVAFYSGGKDWITRRENFGYILPVNSTFSCVSAEVYYSKEKKKDIYDGSLYVPELDHFPTYEEIKTYYPKQMIEKNGIHFARVEPNQGQVRNVEQISNDRKNGKFLGTEYAITELSQILPLYGLTFKRNEYFVIWRDPNFATKNNYTNFLTECKLFIYKYAKMNVFFESSTEKALEIIKRKQYNKIILISSIGLDLSGKKFVEIARQILGFNVVVLFVSANQNHLKWIQNFPNALYGTDASIYKEYILNYNPNGLLNLKNKIENAYKINLPFLNDFFQFPNFKNSGRFDNLIFGAPNPNFKKVIILNAQNKCVLCMEKDKKRSIGFKPVNGLDISQYEWYITMIGNEITLFSNGSYLGVDINQKLVKGEEFMQRFAFEMKNNFEFLIYYQNKSNVLTVYGNYPRIEMENYSLNQVFRLIEQIE